MQNLIEKWNYLGWYVLYGPAAGNSAESIYGPTSKRIAKAIAFSINFKERNDLIASAISGRSVLKDIIETAEHKAGWYY